MTSHFKQKVNPKKMGLVAMSASFLFLLLFSTVSPLTSASSYSAQSMNQGALTPTSSTTYTGYAVSGNFQSTGIRVKGSWIVPTANCVATPNSNSTIAVMIDGINGATDGMIVGTAQNCASGKAQYYAFAIFLPLTTRQRLPTLTINPGDKIEAQGKWDLSTNFWHAQIIDETTGCNGLATCKQAISSGRYATGYLPQLDSGAFLLSSVNGHTLTSLSTASCGASVCAGKVYTSIKQSDIVGPPHDQYTIGQMGGMSGFSLVAYQMTGETLGPLMPTTTTGGSFQISNA